jgi:hypothetical protein
MTMLTQVGRVWRRCHHCALDRSGRGFGCTNERDFMTVRDFRQQPWMLRAPMNAPTLRQRAAAAGIALIAALGMWVVLVQFVDGLSTLGIALACIIVSSIPVVANFVQSVRVRGSDRRKQ